MGSWYDIIGQYGYIAIFAILAIGIIGLPVPDEVLLTYLGYVTSIGEMHFAWTLVFSFAGAAFGISLSYVLGKKLGEPFIRRFGPKLFIREKTIDRTNRLFGKYGSYVLIFCYFIPGVRHIAAYVAGITKYSYKRFAVIAYTGAILWVSTFLVIGNRLGSKWFMLSQYVQQYMWLILLFICVVAVGIIVYIKVSKERNQDTPY